MVLPASRWVAYQTRSLARVQGVRTPSQKLRFTLPSTFPNNMKAMPMPPNRARPMSRAPCATTVSSTPWI
jgi:hypothetical protein